MLSQNKKIIDSFKQAQEEILVATDVAVGLDVDVSRIVLQFAMIRNICSPNRTYGKDGVKEVSWNFVTRRKPLRREDFFHMESIHKFIDARIYRRMNRGQVAEEMIGMKCLMFSRMVKVGFQ